MRGDIEVYEDPRGQVSDPTGIITAPDGDIWFTSIGNGRLGRVRPATGEIETFADERIRLPANIFPAAAGRLWVTCLGSGALASIDPSAVEPGASIRLHTDARLDHPVAIKAAPDGTLWFTLRGGDGAVGSLDPRATDPLATLEIHHSPTIADPSALFVDPAGVVWWVNAGSGTIGRLEPAGAAVTVGLDAGAIGASPRAWAIDAEGWLWVTLRDAPGLLRFDPTAADAGATATTVGHERLVSPDGVWLGVDGALWVADTDGAAIVRYDPAAPTDDAWSFHGDAATVSGPFDIKAGGPGSTRLWFTDKTAGRIGSIQTAG